MFENADLYDAYKRGMVHGVTHQATCFEGGYLSHGHQLLQRVAQHFSAFDEEPEGEDVSSENLWDAFEAGVRTILSNMQSWAFAK